jgi:hypothetical protein
MDVVERQVDKGSQIFVADNPEAVEVHPPGRMGR